MRSRKKRNIHRRKRNKSNKMIIMIGCSNSRKKYLGVSTLAYTGKPIQLAPNPFLAYDGKGGSNIKASYPNTGPPITSNTIFNNASYQLGGCGCGNIMKGGDKISHRSQCKCSECRGKSMKGGNAGIPYPNGLVGSAWTANTNGWPGVDGIGGDRNHIAYNNYNSDISREMVNVGANPPFLNLKGGKKRRQRGGALSNFVGQDLINLGRQFQFGVGSAYNALAGYTSPINPMPWKDQFHSSSYSPSSSLHNSTASFERVGLN
jgi:hypothetical protein